VKKIQDLVQKVRALLEERSTEAAQEVAEEYARLCRQAEARLETVNTMLDKRNDYQALQAAEQPPALLDFIGALSFGREMDWQRYCEQHGLAAAPRLDARAVQRVMGIYENPITAKHPLYKDFRSAMLERDDEKAFRIVRTILKLNPEDATAQREMKRLENKKFQQLVDELKACVESGNREALPDLVEEMESMADADKLARVDVYAQAKALSVMRLKEAGLRELPRLLAIMEQLRHKGDWQGVGATLESWKQLSQQAQGIDPGADQARLAEFTTYHQKETIAQKAERHFETVLRSFMVFVEEMETRLLTSTGFGLEEVRGLDETFVRRWKEMESYNKPVAVDQLRRIQAVGVGLRGRFEAMERARRLRFAGLVGAGVAALLTVSVIGWHAWKAMGMSTALADYRTQTQCLPAESLLKTLRTEEPLLLKWPFLRRGVEESDAWVKQARAAEVAVASDLDALGKALNEKPDIEQVEKLGEKWTQVDKSTTALAKDLQPPHRTRLDAMRVQLDQQIVATQKQKVDRTLKQITTIENSIEKSLSFEKPSASVAKSLKTVDDQLRPLEELAKVTTEGMQLPEDLKVRIAAQRKKADDFKKELDGLAAGREEMGKAATFEDYLKVLRSWQKIRFAEVAPAVKMVDAVPNEKTIMAQILTGGDERTLQAVLEDASRSVMMPETPTDSDVEALIKLRDDAYLNDIYEHSVVDHSKGSRRRIIWSQKPLSSMGLTSGAAWQGKIYDPEAITGTVHFAAGMVEASTVGGIRRGQELLGSRLSLTSELMKTLSLGRMTDEDGKYYHISVFEGMDRIVRNETASPLAKAYVMIKLHDFAEVRSHAWGLHLCPSLGTDVTALEAVLDNTFLASEDWLLKDPQAKFLNKLTAAFQKIKGRSYMKEAQARRDLLSTVARAGLKYGGYVDTDHSLKLIASARSRTELWYLRPDGKPGMMTVPDAGGSTKGTAEKTMVPTARVLSPVFFIPVDRAALVERFQRQLQSLDKEQAPPAAESFFITPP